MHIPTPVISPPTSLQKVLERILAESPDACVQNIRRLAPSLCHVSDEELAKQIASAKVRLSALRRNRG